MFSTLVHTVLLTVFTARHVIADLQIVTPVLTQCQDAIISYSGGKGNYGIYIVPSADPCADSLVDIPEQSGAPYTLKVNLPAGSQIQILVEDSEEDEAWSEPITVLDGPDNSCVNVTAAHSLNATNPASTSAPSLTNYPNASTTLTLPIYAPSSYTYSTARTVQPAAASGIANAANGDNVPQSSGSIPRTVLPAGFLLGVATFLLAMIHL